MERSHVGRLREVELGIHDSKTILEVSWAGSSSLEICFFLSTIPQSAPRSEKSDVQGVKLQHVRM